MKWQGGDIYVPYCYDVIYNVPIAFQAGSNRPSGRKTEKLYRQNKNSWIEQRIFGAQRQRERNQSERIDPTEETITFPSSFGEILYNSDRKSVRKVIISFRVSGFRMVACCVFRPANVCLRMRSHGWKRSKTFKND